jgi:hypothetical protein
MRLLRAVCAALFLVACTLGVPLHSAAAHHFGGTTHVAQVHDHGSGKPASHHVKLGPGALCQLACCAAVAVLQAPFQAVGAPFAYAAEYGADPPASAHGALITPDPFPPKPSRIA